MASKIEIANLGLIALGTRTISSLTQENDIARKINAIFDQCADEVLQAAHWNFATKIEALAKLVDAVPFGWTYIYAFPANCLSIQRLFNESTALSPNPARFRELVAPTSGGRALVADIDLAYAEFTYRVTDTTQYPPAFVKALAHKLAADLALPLTADKQIANGMEQKYQALVSEAKRMNYSEVLPKDNRTSKYLDARG